MLVLNRKVGEVIVIGPSTVPVKVILVENNGRYSRIGVDAPKDVRVDRKEVWERRQREQQHAADD